MKNHVPLVSIGLPTRNRAKIIHEALDTLINQTYKNVEIIISDNESTDNTAEVLQKYLKQDARIRYFRQPKHLHPVKNFNFTLSKARGEYFMWAADDDLWDTKYIETLLPLLEKNKDAVLAVCNNSQFRGSETYMYPPHNLNNNLSQLECLIRYMRSGRIQYIYGLHRTENLRKIGGYHYDFRPFYKGSDYLTVLKMLLQGRMVVSDTYLYSQRDSGYHFERFEVFKNLHVNKQIFEKILRYLSMPIFYFFDLILSTKYVVTSHLTLKNKLIVLKEVIRHYIKNKKEFISNILKGIFSLFVGVKKRLIVSSS